MDPVHLTVAPSGAVSRTIGALTTSTGSPLTDALVGGIVGYLVAPRSERKAFAVGGAVATGLAGVIGLLGTTFVGFERRG